MNLLGPEDPAPYELINPEGASPIVILADHASNRIPVSLDGLGLSPADLQRHIAYDVGVAAVVRGLAERLDATAILHNYSRLLIDPNRDPTDPTSISVISDRTIVPGNRNLSQAQTGCRLETFFRPYHGAIDRILKARERSGRPPLVVALHSFTPAGLGGRPRPWDVGVLWGEDGRISVPLLAALRAETGLVVGDNEPYSARNNHGYTIDRHAIRGGFRHTLIEIRQDRIAVSAGARAWTARLARLLPGLAELGCRTGAMTNSDAA